MKQTYYGHGQGSIYASNVIKPTGRQIQTLGKPMKLVMIKTSATK